MIIPRLAIKNLLGAGLRTWLNVVVLSLSFVAIIWTQGLYRGMGDQASQAMIEAELGGGQYWQPNYDPLDPLALQDAHGVIPDGLKQLIEQGQATPILITQATIYPNGRMITIRMKGTDPNQNILSLPSHFLEADNDEIPALIGSRMAKSAGLEVGDSVTVRWRDAGGTFDARDVTIVQVMRTNVQTIDQGQIWIPIKTMQELTLMENEASLVVISKDTVDDKNIAGWEFKDLDFLLADVKALVRSKSVGASILYVVLIALAMLAIFNTQVLSIFRRKKEMGTLMALGFTRFQIIKLFTLEGALHGVLAAIMAAIYGLPLLIWFSKKGWAMPGSVDSYGFALGEKLFPTYSAGLVLGTTLLVLMITTIVSFLPTRKIAKLKPTEALRGRIT
ncbi:MAG: FtsX-like permease family protein [Candidatus Aminicenantes bacterium]|nr:FtsX-like permease family protein [Candidatus Aminicenantes bacterium]